MSGELSPGLERDLVAARAALARHGVVLIRTIETELEPAVMAGVRRSVASSGRKLSKLDDDALDRLMDDSRKAIRRESRDLQRLLTRLLAKLGAEDIVELGAELEGIEQLFKWDRVSQTVDKVNAVLSGAGFARIELYGPSEVSEAFELELEERWPEAFARFRTLIDAGTKELAEKTGDRKRQEPARPSKRRKR